MGTQCDSCGCDIKDELGNSIVRHGGVMEAADIAAYEAETSGLPGYATSGLGDAYRHLLWSAELTRGYGSFSAGIMTSGWEFVGSVFFGQKNTEQLMDLHNNRLGEQIGKDAQSWEEVVIRVRGLINQAMENPNSPPNPNLPIVIDWTGHDSWNGWPSEPGKDLPDNVPHVNSGNFWSNFRCGCGCEGNAINRDIFNPWHTLDRNGNFRFGIVDPLALDLDGDGIETVSHNGWDGAIFDHNGDGLATASGWIGSDDGLLVLDKNNNNFIDDGSELFGDNTVLSTDEKAEHGFAALADLDSNGDGVIDSQDEQFANLKIWRDANQNGITDEGELLTLTEMGVASLNLAYQNTNQNLGNGNTLAQIGSYTKTDGTVHQMGDINFTTDELHAFYPIPLELTEEQARQVNIKGGGRVRDLREAVTQSGYLNDMLEAYRRATTRDEQLALLGELVESWAKTDPTFGNEFDELKFAVADANSNNVIYVTPSQMAGMMAPEEVIEARKEVEKLSNQGILAILDAFTGTRTRILNLYPDPTGVVKIIKDAYQGLLDSVYDALLLQTRLKPYLDQIEFNLTETLEITVNYGSINYMFEQKYAQDRKNAFIDLAEMMAKGNIEGWNGQAIFSSWVSNATLEGTLTSLFDSIGDRTLAELNIKQIYGTATNNYLSGSSGNDFIYGGDGDDSLFDRAGVNILDGGNGNDRLDGTGTLIGGKGNDILQMYSDSSDTIVFNLGDGQDTITNAGYLTNVVGEDKVVFGQGITADMVTFHQSSIHLIIKIGDQGDQILVERYFNGGRDQTLNRFEFADGTVWEDIRQMVLPLYSYGTAGDDSLSSSVSGKWVNHLIGGDGNDNLFDRAGVNILDGGNGNDRLDGTGTLIGGKGNDILQMYSDSSDTIVFNLGDGQDTITNAGYLTNVVGEDKVVFGQGITADMVTFHQSSIHLIIKIGDQGDQILVERYFNGGRDQTLNRFEFADGTVWEDIRQMVLPLYSYGTAGDDSLSSSVSGKWVNHLIGGDGNDNLFDRAGVNILDGGNGNDRLDGTGTLIGGKGNDILQMYSDSSDTIVFNLGDGQDTITNAGYLTNVVGEDKVVFGQGITADMVTFHQSSIHLIIKIGDQGDQILVERYFNGGRDQTLNRFEFADGTVWEDIRQMVLPLYSYGTAGDDSLSSSVSGKWVNHLIGGDGNDNLFDRAGVNILDGGNGNDRLDGTGTLIGGKGNDILQMYSDSSDTIVFNLGDGQDTITNAGYLTNVVGEDKVVFGQGITADMVTFHQSSIHLIIKIGDQGDQILVERYFNGGRDQTLNRFEFADGTVWEDIRQMVLPLYSYGTAGDDSLSSSVSGKWVNHLIGGDGNDNLFDRAGVNILDGGNGNDRLDGTGTLIGGKGNDILQMYSDSSDTIVFNLGDGQDTITNAGYLTNVVGEDKVVFGQGITADMVTFHQSSIHLIIKIGDQGDQILVERYFNGGRDQTLNRFEFADGTVWEANRKNGADFGYNITPPIASITSQVNNLINAMAAFAPEAGSSSMLPTNQYDPSTVLLGSSAA